MKMLALPLVLAASLVASVFAQDTNATATAGTNTPARIPAAEARQHLNSRAIVFGKIAEVNVAEKLVRLNFERPFPNQVFTAVIFANKTNLFPEVEKLKNRLVEVNGEITDYRGRPQIIVTGTNQLQIVETSSPATEAEKK